MKLKLLAACAALCASSSFALPTITTTPLGTLTSGVAAGGVFTKAVGEFLDLFTFTVTQPSVGVGAVVSFPLSFPNSPPLFSIDWLAPSMGMGGIALLDSAGTTILVADTDPSDGLTISGSLPAGSYQFAVLGNANGSQGGVYAGYIQTQAVPEPEIYAMLLAGLGVVGWVSRRRRQG